MHEPFKKEAGRDESVKQKHSSERDDSGKGDTCRCKETSNMTPRELLKLMINDLTFWRKTNRE